MNTMLSRVADHLYWFGRYIERAEHTARVLNVQAHLALEETAERRRRKLTDMLKALRQPGLKAEGFEEAAFQLALDPQNDASVRSCVRLARENARQVRERISSEMWQQVNRIYLSVSSEAQADLIVNRPNQFYYEVLTELHLVSGLTDSTVSRDQAWHFIQTGKWLERSGLLVTLLETYLQDRQNKKYLDWLGLLKCATAFEAFRKTLGVELNPIKLVDFLLLNDSFPHSLQFSILQLRKSVSDLARETENRKSKELDRLVGKMHHDLDYARAEEILNGDLMAFFDRFRKDLMTVHAMVYGLYISWEVEF